MRAAVVVRSPTSGSGRPDARDLILRFINIRRSFRDDGESGFRRQGWGQVARVRVCVLPCARIPDSPPGARQVFFRHFELRINTVYFTRAGCLLGDACAYIGTSSIERTSSYQVTRAHLRLFTRTSPTHSGTWWRPGR